MLRPSRLPTPRHGAPLVYTHDDIRGLVRYAQLRGVIVVPELDMPAHTSAIGAGYVPRWVGRLGFGI